MTGTVARAQTVPTVDNQEWALLTLINNFRAQNGLGSLQISENIAPVICGFRATSELFIPSPQLTTIRARIAVACADFGRRAIMLTFSRSASTISRGFLGRPVRIPKYEAG